MPYIILDTNIYRELGFDFYNKTDYKNLVHFSIATNNELIISPIVEEELLSHFEYYINEKFTNYINSIDAIRKDKSCKIGRIKFPDISKYIETSIKEFKKKLLNDIKFKLRIYKIENISVDSIDITRFILKTKTQKIPLRDYLIWKSVLHFAKHTSKDEAIKIGKTKTVIPKEKVYFITRDKDFMENEIFRKNLQDSKVDNIEIFNSLAEYFNHIGFQIPFVTKKLLKEYFKANIILQYLNKDIKALATYISPYTEIDYKKLKVFSRQIEGIEIIEFYSYKDPEDKAEKFVAHLKVYVNIIFDSDKSIYKYKDFHDYPIPEGMYLNTFDDNERAQFKAPIFFIFEGLLDSAQQKIKSIIRFDFIPDYYI